MNKFKLVSDYKPCGDQPEAIEGILNSLEKGNRYQTLLGVTGSGKTFTMANIIEKWQKPTLIIAHNKTLAAQLYNEFKTFFPENAVEYFVSYYDYYQPEAYVPESDLYIEKDSSINEQIEKLRLSATKSLLTRRDVIVIASVSCIYGLGSPREYKNMAITIARGEIKNRGRLLMELAQIQYVRSMFESEAGTFRVRGDTIEIFPSYQEEGIRIEMFDDEIEAIKLFDPLTGKTLKEIDSIEIFPSSHYVTSKDRLLIAVERIKKELEERLEFFEKKGKLLEAQRLAQRTNYDIEMLLETGICKGIENYSRHLEGREEGEPPFTLMDYFPEDFLVIVDESHITIPQIGGMYRGDRSRKETLVEYGFRLPSALDNRPLTFEEFEEKINQILFVSATPGKYEIEKTGGITTEQIIRPTGLIDPQIIIKPAKNQVDHLIGEIQKRIEKKERVLVATLTKKMAENLSEYLIDMGIKAKYLHSDIDTLERVEILKSLRKGEFDVLVGVNLLREGLDLPEVSLVAVLDADKEGFLRSETSLIQVSGRAARNVNGTAIFYADKITKAIKNTIKESERRRKKQLEYNRKHGITPKTIIKSYDNILSSIFEKDYFTVKLEEESEVENYSREALLEHIKQLEKKMKKLAKELRFEEAAKIRDQIKELKEKAVM